MQESVFQFSRPKIKNIQYSILEEYKPEENVNLHQHFHRNITRIEQKNEAIVELTIELGCDEKSINSPFALKITIGAIFSWDNTLDEEMINSLLTFNAPALLIGYARPVISNITINSMGAYDLPFISFADEM